MHSSAKLAIAISPSLTEIGDRVLIDANMQAFWGFYPPLCAEPASSACFPKITICSRFPFVLHGAATVCMTRVASAQDLIHRVSPQ